jgi:hypothetical protein
MRLLLINIQGSKASSLSSWFILALGIGAASFWSAAEKDIAESPTA